MFAPRRDATVLREFDAPSCVGYENINRIYPQTDRIFGTETLCGDYTGQVLVLAQDFAPAHRIRQRLDEQRDRNPFFHSEENRTNINLVGLLRRLGELADARPLTRARLFKRIDIKGTNAGACGLVYGSIIWLLKEAASVSASPPRLRTVLDASSPVIKYAIASMPNLDRIVCLGRIAYEGLAHIHGLKRKWRHDLDAHLSFTISAGDRSVQCFPSSHLSGRGLAMRGKLALEACMKDFERALV